MAMLIELSLLRTSVSECGLCAGGSHAGRRWLKGHLTARQPGHAVKTMNSLHTAQNCYVLLLVLLLSVHSTGAEGSLPAHGDLQLNRHGHGHSKVLGAGWRSSRTGPIAWSSRGLKQQQLRGCAISSVSSGGWHNCALSPEINGSHLKCWGENRNDIHQGGQLGLGDSRNRGNNTGQMGDALPAVDLGTGLVAQQVSAGNAHTCVVLTGSGGVKCWGNNDAGQLGLGDTKTRGNDTGQMGDALPAVDLGKGQVAVYVGAGLDHTCALLEGGNVKCWGNNTYGQLGYGDTTSRGSQPGQMGDALPFVDLGTGRTVTQLAVGAWHNCVILDNGDSKCWGLNDSGQLGLGDTKNRGNATGQMGDFLPAINLGGGLKADSLAAGGGHTCAVLAGGVKCWGEASSGQLGLGSTDNKGDTPGSMGDSLPAVDLGFSVTVRQVATGGSHTCAVTAQPPGKIKCWGWNAYGQLGLGDSNTRGDGGKNSSMGDLLPFVDLGTGRTAVQVAAGGYTEGVFWYGHTCARLADGGVKCWGMNAERGVLGLERDTFQIGSAPGDMANLPEVPVCSLHERMPVMANITATSPGDHSSNQTSDVNPGATSATGASDKGHTVSAGLIAGVAIGGVVLLAIGIGTVILLVRKRSQPITKESFMLPPATNHGTVQLQPNAAAGWDILSKTLSRSEEFMRRTVSEYTWVLGETLPSAHQLQAVEEGVNDTQLDRLALKRLATTMSTASTKSSTLPTSPSGGVGGVCPVVRLSAAEFKDQVQLLADGFLGKGGAAIVFKCRWPSRFGPRAVLAAKVLKDGCDPSDATLQSFRYEASLLASIQHPNVVKLYGYCLEPPTVCLILELLPTSLKDLLYKGIPTQLASRQSKQSASLSSLPTSPFAAEHGNTASATTASPFATKNNTGRETAGGTANSSPSVVHVEVVTHALEKGKDQQANSLKLQGSSQALMSEHTTSDTDMLNDTTGTTVPYYSSPAKRVGAAAQGATPWTDMVSETVSASTGLPLAQVVQLSTDIAAGLAYLHSQAAPVVEEAGAQHTVHTQSEVVIRGTRAGRIVHRDLKPANILINSLGQAKISDFGLAREHQNTTIGTVHLGAGTLPYMAPELLVAARSAHLGVAQPATNFVDVYSLGVMMWECLSGVTPWKGKTEDVIYAAVVHGDRPALPDSQLADVLMQHILTLNSEATLEPETPASGIEPLARDVQAQLASLSPHEQLHCIIQACWQQRDLRRPKAAVVYKLLRALLNQIEH